MLIPVWTFLMPLIAVSPTPDVRVEPASILGWNDCIRLSNADIDLVVAPQIGRIIRYGRAGGPNVLWVNPKFAGKLPKPELPEWQNFGGDKLWLAPQSLWGWPPPFDTDPGSWTLARLPLGISLTSSPCKRFGIAFERQITLEPKGTRVKIVNRMVRLAAGEASDQPIAVWQVAQVDRPNWVAFPKVTGPKRPHGYWPYDDNSTKNALIEEREGHLYARRNLKQAYKVGMLAQTKWLASVHGDTAFKIAAEFPPAGTYPDENSAVQLYFNADPMAYAELEFNSPLKVLKIGDACTLTVFWSLESALPGWSRDAQPQE